MSKKKTIMRSFKIHEISAVDTPAQEGARAVLMKRHSEKGIIDEPLEKGAVLTSNELGHSHLIYCLESSGGSTSYGKTKSEADNDGIGHDHPYVITADGKIVIGEAEGHSHTAETFGKDAPKKTEMGKAFGAGDFAYVPDPAKPATWKLRLTDTPGGQPVSDIVDAAVVSLGKAFGADDVTPEVHAEIVKRVQRAWLDANPDKTSKNLPDLLNPTIKENDMTKEEIEKLQADLAKAQAGETVAKKLAALNDAEKAHYNTLSDADKETFLGKSAEDRTGIIKNLSDANPVVFKSASGAEFRKNDDPRLIEMAKQSDSNAAIAKAATDALANNDLQKRATDLFKNSPGTAEDKSAMLKALEAIPDEALRKKAIETAKAGDAALAAAFTRKGATGGKDSTEKGAATEQLDEMAKEHAKVNKCSFEKAYDTVIQSPEGKPLYQQTLN